MAVITLKIAVSNLNEVMDQFDKIKVHRSIVGEEGPYSEITIPATRLALVAGQAIYSFVDTSGETTYYYRSSYYNSISALESSLSDPQLGEGSGALDIVSVESLKTNYLFGLDLTNDDGTPYPDSMYEHYIRSAVSKLEHKLDLPIIPRSIVAEKHDFIKEDYVHYIWLELDQFPVIDVEEVTMVLPGENVVQTFDRDWFQLDNATGQLQLVPGTGSANSILLGATGAWLPLIYSNNKFVPSVFRVTYTAGFEAGQVPPIVTDIVGKIASFGPLNIAGDLLGGAGIASQSVGIDGLSQSFNTTSSATSAGYGARLIQYAKELKEDYKMLKEFYKGIPLRVV